MTLEVREQARLPVRRLLELCADSIRHRLLRSAVTVAITLLAIAFLASIMAEGYLGGAAREAAAAHGARVTAYPRFLRMASQVEGDDALVAALAALPAAGAAVENVLGWGGFDADGLREFLAQSRQAAEYLRFFEGLPIGRRALLVEGRSGVALLDWLSEEANARALAERLAAMRSVRLPGGVPRCQAFLRAWPGYRGALARVRAGRDATVRRIAAYAGAAGLDGRLAAAARDGREADFFAAVAAAGLRLDPGAVQDVLAGRADAERSERALAFLRKAPVRSGWNRQFKEPFNPSRALESCAAEPARVAWVERRLADAREGQGFDAAEFLRVAAEHRRRQALLAREQQLAARYGTARGLSPKTVWLIAVSMLVCVVGIANAMLMSVLERFKEIATMKCLGARNGTIAFLFVMESTAIGVLGGVAGMLVGSGAAVGLVALRYGALAFERFPAGDMGRTLALCFGCSLLLAVLAAIYPARVASRMAPMEAMRID